MEICQKITKFASFVCVCVCVCVCLGITFVKVQNCEEVTLWQLLIATFYTNGL